MWRCADVLIARPRMEAIARALVLGLRMVSFLPGDKDGEQLASGLETRGLGVSADNAMLVSSALEPLLTSAARKDAVMEQKAEVAQETEDAIEAKLKLFGGPL